jgi:antitoxin CcdA
MQNVHKLEINLPPACGHPSDSEVAETKAARWLQENCAAADSWNDYVEQHGLPLSEFRTF